MMRIQKRSQLTGKMNSMDLPITEEQIRKFERGDGLIQKIFPNLTAAEREFLMTGSTQQEWDDLIGPEPDE